MQKNCNGLLFLASFAFFLIGVSAAQGQQPSPSTSVGPSKGTSLGDEEDVVIVNEKREQLVRQYSRVDRELTELLSKRSNIPGDGSKAKEYADQAKKEIELLVRRLEAAKKSGSGSDVLELLERDIGFAEGRRDLAERDANNISDLESKIKLKRDELDQISTELTTVDRRLAQLVNFEKERNSFRKLISGVFCALVGVVIIGFFFLAQNKAIAEDIFSGEKGIQFITLFLVVIAIILFGILGILEGKELSALLGAISGYILGRASKPQTREQDSPSGQHNSTAGG